VCVFCCAASVVVCDAVVMELWFPLLWPSWPVRSSLHHRCLMFFQHVAFVSKGCFEEQFYVSCSGFRDLGLTG
jgi:hypothetical protein